MDNDELRDALRDFRKEMKEDLTSLHNKINNLSEQQTSLGTTLLGRGGVEERLKANEQATAAVTTELNNTKVKIGFISGIVSMLTTGGVHLAKALKGD